MAKRIFLDMDGTVTESKSPIKKAMRDLLLSLKEDVVIISGAKLLQMRKQLGDGFNMMGCNGNHCHYWSRVLNNSERQEVMDFLSTLPQGEDLIQDRRSQISYSLIGHNKPLSKKKLADPNHRKRKEIVSRFHSKTIEASIGGTTCIDFYKKGNSKGDNVLEYIKRKNWKKGQCLYIGDALFLGGNDYTVMGKISTLKNPKETYKFIKTLI